LLLELPSRQFLIGKTRTRTTSTPFKFLLDLVGAHLIKHALKTGRKIIAHFFEIERKPPLQEKELSMTAWPHHLPSGNQKRF
jgi:hypothetical protein